MISVDKIGQIVESMEIALEIDGDYSPDVDGNVTIPISNTAYLYPFKEVTIDGRDAKVVDMIWNTQLVLKFNDAGGLDAGTYVIANPLYTWGTIREFNNEMSQIRYTGDKYPIVYLFERFRETEYHGSNDALDREADVRLFFLSNYNPNDYTIKDHYNYVIKAMTNLKNSFIESVKRNPKIDELTTSDNTNFVMFGTYTDNNGNIEHLIGDNLTGIEMRITIPFFKDCC